MPDSREPAGQANTRSQLACANPSDAGDACGLCDWCLDESRRNMIRDSLGRRDYPYTATVGDLIALLSWLPSDFPVTVGTPDGGGWLNITGVTNPLETDEQSAILCTADDFDTRQF